ncbi:hypothetical protein TTHERM_001277501 (macronuclear) [Tetrahymena thermophila SB210]|uniref:Uncharacterized protein n=1 Tax=Tetrahymena thermophila (strain SB210) TaxID=312017 RepID=W7X115_TETTS|nr:hypothetical protein TTHERM_001277501 [Tetrahymena thermophila SB210]EWS72855.1 hypothetical protein TTHERM_001277501 [Tetrahymena thermophila SB210]|eukprot:XP_012654609.1 hypothetical protein TTHERM_001277501 [Tetrahymena thermophila SB210]
MLIIKVKKKGLIITILESLKNSGFFNKTNFQSLFNQEISRKTKQQNDLILINNLLNKLQVILRKSKIQAIIMIIAKTNKIINQKAIKKHLRAIIQHLTRKQILSRKAKNF